MAYYLGIDVGTSGSKALIMNARGKPLGTATGSHDVLVPRPGWSEQDPEDWWKATVRAVRGAIRRAGVDGKQIAGIGFSGQMHGLVITDEAGKALRPSLIWNDQRTAPQAAEIEQAVGGKKKLIALAGNVAQTSFTLTKLLWVRRHEPKTYDAIRHLLLPKDYVRLRLTGQFISDVSDASGTLLLDQKKRDWSRKMISIFQIDRDILPPVVESHEVSGTLTASAATRLGLARGTPVVGGGGDQPVGAVGNGIVTDGLTNAVMGTSGVVYVHLRQYRTDPQSRVGTFCAAVPGQWGMFGCTLAAGGSLQWYRNVLGQGEVARARRKGIDPYEILMAQAEQAPAGCEGVFWLPYLTGERTPYSDPLAKACWIGIHSRTTRNELVRAVIEGATFAMNDTVSLLGRLGVKIRQIRLSGGGARSRFWRRLQADIYGRTCVTINAEEGPAYGAALLAATGTGRFKNIREACKACIRVTRTIRPRPKAKRLYKDLHAQYVRLYPALKDQFARIAELPT